MNLRRQHTDEHPGATEDWSPLAEYGATIADGYDIRCGGRAVDTALHARGPECGATYTRRGHRSEAERIAGARAAGWRIGILPDGGITATCPACSKPDPATLAAVREIEKGTTR